MGKRRNCVLVIKWTDEVKFGPEDKLGHSSLFTCLGRREAKCLYVSVRRLQLQALCTLFSSCKKLSIPREGQRNSNVVPDHAMKAYKGNRIVTPLIIILVSVNITPLSLYTQEMATVPTE
jgi:hypothetical protein